MTKPKKESIGLIIELSSIIKGFFFLKILEDKSLDKKLTLPWLQSGFRTGQPEDGQFLSFF